MAQPDLERNPNIDAAMLRAGVAAVLGAGEKAVMATGRSTRVIVPVLSGRIGTAVLMMLVALHRRVIVMMLLRILIAMVVGMVLCPEGHRGHGAQGKRRQRENNRLPIFVLHGHWPLVVGTGCDYELRPGIL